jgi:release factor glutamine methyltransferase
VTIAEALATAAAYLSERGVPSPRNDAELLLSHSLGVGRTQLYVGEGEIGRDQRAAFERLVERRGRREPLAYVLGDWGFRRLTLKVDPRVLVPRPETEVVVERCLELIAGVEQPRVLDVGTGSGAIALAVADEHLGARVTGIDSLPAALEVARANAEATGLEIELREHDLAAGLGFGEFDLVVSNPPYVRPDEIELLEPEVRDWEPRSALVGEGVAEQVATRAPEALRDGGWLVLEVAAGNARAVAAELRGLGYVGVRSTRDLAGVERVVEGQWEPSRTP